ncbi:PREDICTED: probable serine/threonine-protein kinase DDB_G0280133 [Polistes dominula]|uniref:Probable serine/threonine-protein kinase DDB_G0280133 n=1 Tax=Polistes dominula TaxID=743375 RepID=A0ABM1I752_POLDO|nr:PREDICTED: probable serine/threonine-protein kinase DDB_G0280133 [Polistes dominula]
MIVIYSTSPLSSAVDTRHASASLSHRIPFTLITSPVLGIQYHQIPITNYQRIYTRQEYCSQLGLFLRNLKISWSLRPHQLHHHTLRYRPGRTLSANNSHSNNNNNNNSNSNNNNNNNSTIICNHLQSVSNCPPVARVTMVTDSPSTLHQLQYQHPGQIKFALLPTDYHNQQHRDVLIVLPLHHTISESPLSTNHTVSSLVEQHRRHYHHHQRHHQQHHHHHHHQHQQHQDQQQIHQIHLGQRSVQQQIHHQTVYPGWYNGVPIRSPVLQYLYPPVATTTMTVASASQYNRNQEATGQRSAIRTASPWYPRVAALYHPNLCGTGNFNSPYLGGHTASPPHPLQVQQARLFHLQQLHQPACPQPLVYQASPYNGVPQGWCCTNPYLAGRIPRPFHIHNHQRPRHKGPA